MNDKRRPYTMLKPSCRTPALPLALALAGAVVLAACPGRGGQGTAAAADADGAYALAVVAELAEARYGGRQAGSPGGRAAGDYLRAELEGFGLSVSFQEFPERAAFYEGEPELRVELPGKAAREYRYRAEYRDLVRGGYEGGAARGPLAPMDEPGQVLPPGSIALVPYSVFEKIGLDGIAAAGAAGALMELGAGSVRVKPLFAGQEGGTLVDPKRGLVALAMDPAAWAELRASLGTGGATASVVSPVRFRDVTGRNIVAAWNGDGGDFKPRVAFMAHYDHVGLDPDGGHFPGALDNASGVGLVLALAKAFAADGRRADAAFILTDAEESGLTGAGAFAEDPGFPLAGVPVINIDMVASIRKLDVGVLYSTGQASGALAARVAEVLLGAGFRAGAVGLHYGCDHAPLARAGAAAVTVNEYDTADYHTRGDLPPGVDLEELDAACDALYALALELAAGR